jgi:hypothetical protein
MQFSIPARQPFNFLSVVNSHGWVQLAPFTFDQEGQMLSYVLRLASGRVIEIGMSAAEGGVSAQAKGRLTRPERDELARAVTWMFGLDMDFSAFYKATRGEPKLRRAAKLVSHEWYEGGTVGPKEVEAAFEKWGEFKGLAFWFWDWKYTG